jgi:hypothetical protein
MTEPDKEYYWVVLCKNWLFRFRHDYRHRILLGVTDSYSSPPTLNGPFKAQCNDCGKEYVYHSGEVLRFETVPPEAFVPHPLFSEEGCPDKLGQPLNSHVKFAPGTGS